MKLHSVIVLYFESNWVTLTGDYIVLCFQNFEFKCLMELQFNF